MPTSADEITKNEHYNSSILSSSQNNEDTTNGVNPNEPQISYHSECTEDNEDTTNGVNPNEPQISYHSECKDNEDTTNGVNPNEPQISYHSECRHNTTASTTQESTNTCHSISSLNTILLKTAVTTVQCGEISCTARLFLDEGSSLSYISTELAEKLQVKSNCKQTVHVNTFGGKTQNNTFDVCSVDIITDEGTSSGITNRSIHLLHPLEVSLEDPKEHFSISSMPSPQKELPKRSKRVASRARPRYVETAESRDCSE
jgi:hypothetical protein